jgi:xanthine dehydrogenase YagR molybdenum-binding subunit
VPRKAKQPTRANRLRAKPSTDEKDGVPISTRRRFVTTRVEVEGREEVKVVELPAFESAPWTDDTALTIVGQAVPRSDALEKVTGRAIYTADLARQGMLHCAILRAPVASGQVTRLDLSAARAIPGVRAAISHGDVPRILVEGFPLFDLAIHYGGQPLAAVCADSPELARRGLDAIALEVDASAHALTTTQALAEGAPAVCGSRNMTKRSPRVSERGDVRRGMEEAKVVIEREYRTPTALHTALEPHGAVAEWIGDAVTVWESTQAVFAVRNEIAEAFDLPHSRVRVIKDYMGGGFGAKNNAGAHTYIAVFLSRHLGRPVRCVLDREGEQTDAGNRPATVQRVTLGATGEGRLTAIILDADVALGTGGWEGGPGRIYQELYACPNVRTTERFVYTNTAPMASFRAPGHVEGAFGLERAMDTLARELGLDPLELRLRNHAARDQIKNRPYTAKHLEACYHEGARRFGWRERQSVTRGALRRGFGMASQIWGGGGGPPAYATVTIHSDGTIDVLSGTQDLGTGARTILAQIAAEALGGRLEDVHTILGDTERTPYAPNSWGSMTTASVGPAVRMAAEDARARLAEAAAGMLGVEPPELEIRGGVVRAPDGRSMTFSEVSGKLGDVMISGNGSRGPNPDEMAIATFGAQFAEVEVNVETGVVRVLRIVAAHDAGRIINPLLAESQLEGGILQGLGYALFEERVMDSRLGVSLNPTTHDYKVPTHSDVPRIEAFFVGGADTAANHTGAKGLAEPPIIPTAPAIANAVADALGREVNEIPLTPWRVLVQGGGQRAEGGGKA